MSYKATNWAYELPLVGPQKFVLVALADMADEANTCYPGQQRLAQMTGVSVATIRRALLKLEASGLIEREHRTGNFGYRTSDRYKLSVGLTVPESLPLTEPTRQSAHRSESQSLPLTQSIPTAQSAGAEENHQYEPSVEPTDPFDSFWAIYPHKIGKGQARTAYKTALKKTDAATIAAAAAVYAKSVANSEPKFIAHPTTWLNGERWDDEAAKPATATVNPKRIGGPGGLTAEQVYAEQEARAEEMLRRHNAR